MDPNETLKRLRELSEQGFPTTDNLEDADEFHALFRDLDEWLSKGGFLPTAWQRNVECQCCIDNECECGGKPDENE